MNEVQQESGSDSNEESDSSELDIKEVNQMPEQLQTIYSFS